MLKNLKVILIGGRGYVGSYLAARTAEQRAIVKIVSRNVPHQDTPVMRFPSEKTFLEQRGCRAKQQCHAYPNHPSISILKGDISRPATIKEELNEADVVIHLVGTLIDWTAFGQSTRRFNPFPNQSYQRINRDLFIGILDQLTSKKKVIYFSSNSHPPLFPLYLTTKDEAEQYLMESNHNGFVVKPGYIYNKYDEHDYSSKLICNVLEVMKQPPTEINALSDCIIELMSSGSNTKSIDNKQITTLSNKFRSSAPDVL